MILVLLASNPAGITSGFGFQIQECMNVVHEKSPLVCFGVVLCYLILVDLMDLEYTLSLLHSQLHIIHYPGTQEGSILILGMRTHELMFYTGRT